MILIKKTKPALKFRSENQAVKLLDFFDASFIVQFLLFSVIKQKFYFL